MKILSRRGTFLLLKCILFYFILGLVILYSTYDDAGSLMDDSQWLTILFVSAAIGSLIMAVFTVYILITVTRLFLKMIWNESELEFAHYFVFAIPLNLLATLLFFVIIMLADGFAFSEIPWFEFFEIFTFDGLHFLFYLYSPIAITAYYGYMAKKSIANVDIARELDQIGSDKRSF